MKIMTVDMDKQAISVSEERDSWRKWWGRSLIARILLDEMDATSEPLGPGNILIFTRGPLAGTGISSASRLSVGGKSPLTGGVKEANAGGNAGDYLGRLGIKAILVKGWSAVNKIPSFVLEISGGGESRLVDSPEVSNLGSYEMAKVLHAEYGDDAAIILNGPAGTFKMASTAVMCTDRDGIPTRAAARGGLGAVMGSKGLKAIVMRRPEAAPGRGPAADQSKLAEARRLLNEFVLANSDANPGMRKYGTAGMVSTMTNIGGLPTRNYSAGQFEQADNLKGVTLHQVVTERGGQTGHPCMTGCLVRCSNVFVDREGREVVRALEYETLAMMGSNLGIGDLDEVARFNWECNDLGVDTIETGAAIGVAMDAGLWKFGDVDAVMEALGHIRKGDVLGRVIGAGAAVVGKVLGWHRVPAVKGQSMAAYDPRAVKGIGVTYATSPMGADHTAGHTVAAKVDHHAPEGQVEASRNAQVNRGAYDSIDICSFAMGGFSQHLDLMCEAISAVTGETFAPSDIPHLGRECLLMEREFNRRAGITEAGNRIPEFMRTEKLPPYDVVFDVTDEDMGKIFNFDEPKTTR